MHQNIVILVDADDKKDAEFSAEMTLIESIINEESSFDYGNIVEGSAVRIDSRAGEEIIRNAIDDLEKDHKRGYNKLKEVMAYSFRDIEDSSELLDKLILGAHLYTAPFYGTIFTGQGTRLVSSKEFDMYSQDYNYLVIADVHW